MVGDGKGQMRDTTVTHYKLLQKEIRVQFSNYGASRYVYLPLNMQVLDSVEITDVSNVPLMRAAGHKQ